MKTWKWMAAAAALVVAPELALAQSPEGPRGPGGFLARFDADGDGKVTLAEVEAAAQAQLTAADADGDGQVTVEELRDGQVAARFKALDADGDGKITLGEFQAQPQGGRRGGAGMMARDEDGDGKLSLAELTAMPRRMFDMADADHDGALTAEELAAGRPEGGRFGRGPGGEEGQGGGRRRRGEGEQGEQGGRGRGRGSPEDMFARLDGDGDGALTLDELKTAGPRRRPARPAGEGEIY